MRIFRLPRRYAAGRVQDLAPDEQATTFVINEKPVTDQDGQTVTKKIVRVAG